LTGNRRFSVPLKQITV